MTYQVEMGAETHNQLERPDLTYRTRHEAMRSMREVLKTHGRIFTEEEDGDVVIFRGEGGGALATLRPVQVY